MAYNVYGGGNNDIVKGNTHLTFSGNAKANYVFGGSSGSGKVKGTNVSFLGGKVMSLCGGNDQSSDISTVTVSVEGGEMEQLFGANQRVGMTGNVNLKISSVVNISLDAKDEKGDAYEDLSIYACSRYNKTHGGEVCTITFLDEAAYTKYNQKLGANDLTMSILMMRVTNYYTLVKSY